MLPEMLEDPYVEVSLQAPPSPDYIPGPEEPEQAPPSPDYVLGSEHFDFEAHPEDDDDEDPEEDPVDYLADGGDDDDDEEGSSEDDEDDDMDIKADEEEEHPAPADSVVVALTAANQAPSAEETKPFETDESAATPPPHHAYRMTAKISIPTPVPVLAWSDSKVVRLLAMSSPPSSPLSPWSSPPPQIPFPPLPLILSPPLPAASTSHSPPLPPPFILSPTRLDAPSSRTPLLLPISAPTSSPPLQLPSASRREDRPEVTLLPRKRLGIALGLGYEVGESSSAAAAARPAGGLRADYGFVATMDREIMHDPEREVGYGITDSVRQDTEEIYMRLDDEQSEQQLLAGRLNMLFRDRRAHAYTRHLMETEVARPLPDLLAPPPSPIHSLGYRAAMIRLRSEAASTSHSPPLPPPFILSPTRSDVPSSGIPLLLPISASTSSPPLQLPTARESSSAAATRPAGGLKADYDFVATMDREIMHDPEREVGYGITNLWDEILETLQGAPVRTDTELGGYMREFETRVRQDTDEINMRLDDKQNVSDLVSGEVMSLRTTVLGQMIEIRELHATDRRRQIVILEMLRADHRRSTKIIGLRTSLQGQMIALQGQKQMAPKRTTRSTADQETINTTSVTNAQLQAMIDQGVTVALAAHDALRSTNGDDSHNSGTGVRRIERATRECTYTDFLKCQPLHFKGTEGVASLSQWFERMESVFHISNCAVENQVKFATCTLHSVALTWWNTHVKAVGHDAAYGMPWKTLMKMMTDKYCPQNEIRKLEMEIECPKLKNNNNHGDQGGRNNAPARVYAVGRARTDPDANVVTVITCAEKIVRIPWGNETLIIHGDGSNQGNATQLSIISCTKIEKYMMKGFPIFLAHITTKEIEDKSEKK
nr:hypothetical protein [Tanacetum cinerariifolium]